MQKNNGTFSMEDAQRLAASPQAKQLQELIQNTDRARMEVAAKQAAAGNYTELGLSPRPGQWEAFLCLMASHPL